MSSEGCVFHADMHYINRMYNNTEYPPTPVQFKVKGMTVIGRANTNRLFFLCSSDGKMT